MNNSWEQLLTHELESIREIAKELMEKDYKLKEFEENAIWFADDRKKFFLIQTKVRHADSMFLWRMKDELRNHPLYKKAYLFYECLQTGEEPVKSDDPWWSIDISIKDQKKNMIRNEFSTLKEVKKYLKAVENCHTVEDLRELLYKSELRATIDT